MTSASDIKGQSLSTLVCDYFICPYCGIIDRDEGRMCKGHPCSNCSVEGNRARLGFGVNIMLLVDLVQETYHSEAPSKLQSEYRPKGRDIGTVLMICSLREALLNNFLSNNLLAKKVDRRLIERLLDDNKLTNQKFQKLFPTVVGLKWDEAITALSRKHSVHFAEVSSLLREVAKARNQFLHEGSVWKISPDLSERCINSLFKLIYLFVCLHNEYTQPFWGGNDEAATALGG